MQTIYIKSKPKTIARRKDGSSGIIRINEEACDILEGLLNRIRTNMSVCELASILIKGAVENNIIKEEEI